MKKHPKSVTEAQVETPVHTEDDPIENIPVAVEKPRPLNVTDDGEELETLVSSAEYWPFETNPVFSGIYRRLFVREHDDEKDPTKKAGDIIGFICEQDHTQEEWIIGNSYQIQKGIEQVIEGERIRITFMGKTTNAKNQPLNKFLVQKYKNQ